MCRSGALLDFCQPLLSKKAQPGWFKLHAYKAGETLVSQFEEALRGFTLCSLCKTYGPGLLFFQGLNNAVALDFHYAEQMIYWTDVTTQGSMIRRMHLNDSNIEVGGESFHLTGY